MKLSDIVNEIQEFIDAEGDRDISGIDVYQDSSNYSATRIEKTDLCCDGRKAVLSFYA